jgi:hypothetical protein
MYKLSTGLRQCKSTLLPLLHELLLGYAMQHVLCDWKSFLKHSVEEGGLDGVDPD